MPYTNVHEFTGRLGENPVTRYFPSSAVVSKFDVAVKPPYKSETPIWCACEAWGKLAEVAANHLKKGQAVSIQGEMKLETWTDKNTGEIRSKTVFNVKRLELSSKPQQPDEVAGTKSVA